MNAAQAGLPDGHVLVDVVDISKHDFSRQHREGEGAWGGITCILGWTYDIFIQQSCMI